MITRHVKEYSVSSISVNFWKKKCCLLQKFARFACFITCKRVVKGFGQLSIKPCSVNFLKSLVLKEVKFPIVLLLSSTKLRYLCRKYCFKRLKFTRFFYLVTRFLFNSTTMHHHDDSVFEKLRFRATTLKLIDALSNVSGFRSVPKAKASVFDRCSVVAR